MQIDHIWVTEQSYVPFSTDDPGVKTDLVE